MNEKEIIADLTKTIEYAQKCCREDAYINQETLFAVLNLLKKKDKIIGELEDIFYNYQLCEYELTDCTYRKCEYISDDEIPPCKECIKQYFERNVEK